MSTALQVSVRLAGESDLDFLADAHRLAHAAITDARGGTLDTAAHGRREPIADTFAPQLDSESFAVLIGELDATAVGYAVLERSVLPDTTVIGSIESIWVHPEARGVGIGAALLSEVTSIAKNWQCASLDSRALPGDRVTKNFFESFGLVARSIQVHRPL